MRLMLLLLPAPSSNRSPAVCVALSIVTCLCLVTLLACRSARFDPRLQGTWRSNKDATVSRWQREGVLATRVIDAFRERVLGKMSVTYSGRNVTSTTGSDWTEISEYHVVDSGDDFVVFDQFSNVYKRMLRYRVRFVRGGYWISNDDILHGYIEKFDLVSR